MRPRLLHLGYIEAGKLVDALIGVASMRPRLLHLGYNIKQAVRQLPDDVASMRPRLLHLGYVDMGSWHMPTYYGLQ